MRSLLVAALIVALASGLDAQEVQDASQLQRVDWPTTQTELRRWYPLLLREAGIAALPEVVATIDSTGVVSDPSLPRSTGHARMDRGALVGALAFRFRAPVAPGRYRIVVPFVVDSLLPTPSPLECFPEQALIDLVRSAASRVVHGPGGAVINEWNFRPYDRAGNPPDVVPHRLRLTASPKVFRACRATLESWPPRSAADISSGREGFRLCSFMVCDELPGIVERDYQIHIADFRLSWPPHEWTFWLEGTAARLDGRWIMRCEDSRFEPCTLVHRPLQPLS